MKLCKECHTENLDNQARSRFPKYSSMKTCTWNNADPPWAGPAESEPFLRSVDGLHSLSPLGTNGRQLWSCGPDQGCNYLPRNSSKINWSFGKQALEIVRLQRRGGVKASQESLAVIKQITGILQKFQSAQDPLRLCLLTPHFLITYYKLGIVSTK